MREFETGAIRDTEEGKLDYEGFLSPYAVERFARYMHKHRETPNGLRDSDNWQKGIPIPVYMKSMFRHVVEAWKAYRRVPGAEDLEESLCAIWFNVQGILHELLAKSYERAQTPAHLRGAKAAQDAVDEVRLSKQGEKK